MKRSDITTFQVLDAVAEGNFCTSLFEAFPLKVVYAALEREVRRDLVDYGVTMRSGWLTPEGRDKLAAHNGVLNDIRLKVAEIQKDMDRVSRMFGCPS